MKNQIKSAIALLLCVLSIFCLVACADKVDAVGVWEDATYRSDKEFGEGSKTIEVEVKVEEQSVTFTIHTDRLQFDIDAAWTHLPTADDHYIYYLILDPNTALAADIIANDGNIQVSAQITKDEIAAMTDIAIVLRAAVVQIGEFASPAAAWASLTSKGG